MVHMGEAFDGGIKQLTLNPFISINLCNFLNVRLSYKAPRKTEGTLSALKL